MLSLSADREGYGVVTSQLNPSRSRTSTKLMRDFCFSLTLYITGAKWLTLLLSKKPKRRKSNA
jgi:hypothetical protein